jgi:hypothetical protein
MNGKEFLKKMLQQGMIAHYCLMQSTNIEPFVPLNFCAEYVRFLAIDFRKSSGLGEAVCAFCWLYCHQFLSPQ